MINLYIDTNAYLTFYHLTNDDLEELKKLKLLIEKNEIKLYLPEQTFDEFNRNREVKIADALKRFKEEKLNNQFPTICKDYPEYTKMRDAIKEYDKNKSLLLHQMTIDSFNNNLAADKIINILFQKAFLYPTTSDLVKKAKLRYDLGRPPGKNKSYGDAVNWESLLENVLDNEDLFFVADDKDFYSEIDTDRFNSYLLEEWKKRKNSHLFHFRRISDFFKQQYPEIKIASEYEKETLLKEFDDSYSFANARYNLHKLSQFEDYSTKQINDFVTACINNNQIYWIRDDYDIKDTIQKIINLNKDKIDVDLKMKLDEIYDYTK